MIHIELSALINKLNSQTRLALEQAGALSISRQNSEVTFEHLLCALLDNPLSDVRTLIKQTDLEFETVRLQTHKALSQESHHSTTPVFSPLLVELLQDAWLLSSTEFSQTELRSGVIFIAALMRADRYLPMNLVQLFEVFNRETLRRNFDGLTAESAESPLLENKQDNIAEQYIADTALGRFCTNFTALAKQGELDPVLCRDEEINLMIDILSRRRKNNPIAVGEAGVGKSAIVEGLAQRIVTGQVPDALQNVDLWSLDLGLLQAGASVKGEFEKRLKAIIDEVKSSPIPIILFIDEAHTLIGAGNQEGAGMLLIY